MKNYQKIGTVLTLATMTALQASSAFSVELDGVAPALPGPGAFGLVVAGIAAAIFVARRSK